MYWSSESRVAIGARAEQRQHPQVMTQVRATTAREPARSGSAWINIFPMSSTILTNANSTEDWSRITTMPAERKQTFTYSFYRGAFVFVVRVWARVVGLPGNFDRAEFNVISHLTNAKCKLREEKTRINYWDDACRARADYYSVAICLRTCRRLKFSAVSPQSHRLQ